MAFFDPLKRQLRSVIQWDDANSDALFYKWSSNGDEIKNASKLIVGPTQGCIFVYEGKIKAVFHQEGLYEIATSNIPFLTTLKKFMQFFESEHKVELYFYKKNIIADQKWGTVSPIKYIDPVYKFPIELFAFGNYSLQIKDAKNFFVSIVSEEEYFGVDELRTIINARLVHPMSDAFAESKISYNHIDEQREELGEKLRLKLDKEFHILGFTLLDFRIEGTEFDEKSKNRINKIADTQATHYAAQSVGVSYKDMRQLDALNDAATNEAGAAGVFMGANAGNMLSSNLSEPLNNNNSSNNKGTIVERLTKLKSLFEAELISSKEYEAKKHTILEEL
ncbi:MAG: SPFH domain-containing protein [Campylobacterota bacterium]|nr:SPFH domain-containing protein [Campylobacterota bacterium]